MHRMSPPPFRETNFFLNRFDNKRGRRPVRPHSCTSQNLRSAPVRFRGCGHCQESRMLLVTQLMAFWFYYLTAEQRVLYRPELGQNWVRFRGRTDSSQMTGGLQQANSMRITGQLRQVCEQQQ